MLRTYRKIFYKLTLLCRHNRRHRPEDLAWAILSAAEIVLVVTAVTLVETFSGIRLLKFSVSPTWTGSALAIGVLVINHGLLVSGGRYRKIVEEFDPSERESSVTGDVGERSSSNDRGR